MKTPLSQMPSAGLAKPQKVAEEPLARIHRARSLHKTSEIRSDRWLVIAEAIGGVLALFGLLFTSLLFTPD